MAGCTLRVTRFSQLVPWRRLIAARRFLRLSVAAEPTGWVEPGGDAAAKAGERPIARVSGEAVLHRIEVDVVHVRRVVAILANRMLPVAALPDATLTLAGPAPPPLIGFGHRFGECG